MSKLPSTSAITHCGPGGKQIQIDRANTLRTSTQVQLDLRLLKYFKVGEHGKLDFVAESFNLLNHTNVVRLNQFFGPGAVPISVFKTPNRAGIARQLQFSIDFEF